MKKQKDWELRNRINQILIDYGLVRGGPLEKDIVDKILMLFEAEGKKWQEELEEKKKKIEGKK